MTVRIAGPLDEPALFLFLRHVYDTETIPGPAFDPDRVMAAIQQGTRGRGALIGVIGTELGIEASACVLFDQWWFSRDAYLAERWCYVRPEHRDKPHWRDLIAWVKETRARISSGHDLPLLLGVQCRTRVEAKIRMYNAEPAFTLIGATFLIR